ncbi:MAG: ABC transporter ATP-binding protein [Agathobacter sp.]|nr:ABC transporter ATP-binding protein [Agathobacter sp.]
MKTENIIEGRNIQKRLRNFELNIPQLNIPKGFATALIGENGAGKTTLLNILSGIRLDAKGDLLFFNEFDQNDREKKSEVKNRIGYTCPGKYYLPQWSIREVEEVSQLLFDTFDRNKFDQLCEDLAIFSGGITDKKKKVSSLSDGMKMKLMLAGVFARETDVLILDEPASPLDPLMRDKLNQMIGEYIHEGAGEKSVFFSTHNISDMESITDYAIIMEHGTIVEEGFVEDLKEKYILIKGDANDAEAAGKVLYSMTKNPYGFEGICLAEDLDKLAGMNVSKEIPSLYQISVAVMRNNTLIKMR